MSKEINPRQVPIRRIGNLCHNKLITKKITDTKNICTYPEIPYITWGLIWDLKTKKHRDPRIKKDFDIHTHTMQKKELI